MVRAGIPSISGQARVSGKTEPAGIGGQRGWMPSRTARNRGNAWGHWSRGALPMTRIAVLPLPKRSHCTTVIYDAEILAGWAPHDDSNLNTLCANCNNATVPKLNVTARRYVRRDVSNSAEGGHVRHPSVADDDLAPWSVHDSWYKPTKRALLATKQRSPQKRVLRHLQSQSSEHLPSLVTQASIESVGHRRTGSDALVGVPPAANVAVDRPPG